MQTFGNVILHIVKLQWHGQLLDASAAKMWPWPQNSTSLSLSQECQDDKSLAKSINRYWRYHGKIVSDTWTEAQTEVCKTAASIALLCRVAEAWKLNSWKCCVKTTWATPYNKNILLTHIVYYLHCGDWHASKCGFNCIMLHMPSLFCQVFFTINWSTCETTDKYFDIQNVPPPWTIQEVLFKAFNYMQLWRTITLYRTHSISLHASLKLNEHHTLWIVILSHVARIHVACSHKWFLVHCTTDY